MSYQTEHEANSVRITERLFLRVVLIFAVIHSPCKHALRKESTIKRSVDDLELLYSQSVSRRGQSARIIGFLSSRWSGFRQLKQRGVPRR